jgi:hypothetical protein
LSSCRPGRGGRYTCCPPAIQAAPDPIRTGSGHGRFGPRGTASSRGGVVFATPRKYKAVWLPRPPETGFRRAKGRRCAHAFLVRRRRHNPDMNMAQMNRARTCLVSHKPSPTGQDD